jgi:hypothetical protein
VDVPATRVVNYDITKWRSQPRAIEHAARQKFREILERAQRYLSSHQQHHSTAQEQ